MSIWGEIKHSINSDLNKPLNVLINGTKGLTASDNLYAVLTASEFTANYNTQLNIPIKATMNWNGSFNVKCYLYLAGSTSNVKLTIYKNGIQYTIISGGSSSESNVQRSATCTCSKGDIFTFVLDNYENSRNYTAYLSGLGIYADISDISGVTIESV